MASMTDYISQFRKGWGLPVPSPQDPSYDPATNLGAGRSYAGRPVNGAPASPSDPGAAPPLSAPAGAPRATSMQARRMASVNAPPDDGSGGVTFMDLAKKAPAQERSQWLDHLESTVGSINKAYDEMMKDLGKKPEKGLTREDKGLLLMQFGMSLMQASGPSSAHGSDVGSALGEAGAGTINSYLNMRNYREGQVDKWEAKKNAIDAARIGSQEKLLKETREGMNEENLSQYRGRMATSREQEVRDQAKYHAGQLANEQAQERRLAAENPGIDQRIKIGTRNLEEARRTGNKSLEWSTKRALGGGIRNDRDAMSASLAYAQKKVGPAPFNAAQRPEWERKMNEAQQEYLRSMEEDGVAETGDVNLSAASPGEPPQEHIDFLRAHANDPTVVSTFRATYGDPNRYLK